MLEGYIAEYHENGFVLAKNLLAYQKTELEYINSRIEKYDYEPTEKRGFETALESISTSDEVDILTYITRQTPLINFFELVWNEKAYLDHSKFIMKKSQYEGFEPHQDSWYWRGIDRFRNLHYTGAACIALCKTTIENGCVSYYKKSHHEIHQHEYANNDICTNVENFDKIDVEMDLGDVLFFSGNTIHSSSVNSSNKSRPSLVGCYRGITSSAKGAPMHGGMSMENIDITKCKTPSINFMNNYYLWLNHNINEGKNNEAIAGI